MKLAVLSLVAILVAFGIFNNVNALTNGSRPPEAWLTEMVPTRVGDFDLQVTNPGSKCTYRMDEATYKELDPIGIAAQRYTGPNSQGFDAVVIASNNMESFHDQRWCFKAQGWEIVEESYTELTTKTYGTIPVSLVKVRQSDAAPVYSVFTFRGPTKFHAETFSMSKDFFFHELTKQTKFVGYQYRFIPGWPDATKEDVLRFAGQYIDAAHDSSKGTM